MAGEETRPEYRGLSHYVQETAAEMRLADGTPAQPVSLARRSRALQLIENQITGAARAPEAGQRPAILEHVGELIRSLELQLEAGMRMVRDAYGQYGLSLPDWSGAPAPVAGAAPAEGDEEPPARGGTGEGRTPHVAGTVTGTGEPITRPVDPNPMNPAADPALFHPTEGRDFENPAAGTVDPQLQVDVPPESQAPRDTGLDRPRPADEAAGGAGAGGAERPPATGAAPAPNAAEMPAGGSGPQPTQDEKDRQAAPAGRPTAPEPKKAPKR